MSIWQTKKWQEMLKESNQIEKSFELRWIFIEKRKVAMWEYWLFVVWGNFSTFDHNLEKELLELAKEENSLFIQIENIDYSSLNLSINSKNFKPWFYKKFITPYTAVINIEESEDIILSKMKPKWRYNIRLAEKKWVVVKEYEKNKKNIKDFYNLIVETTTRDWFSWNSLDYYEKFLNLIPESKLLSAEYDWKIIASWIFTYNGDTVIYYYWASTSDKEYRNLMAPYLLQWTAIKIWKDSWFKLYDFLWVSSPWEENSSLAWVTDFKKKFTSDIRKVSSSYIYVNKKFKYWFINFLRKIKK